MSKFVEVRKNAHAQNKIGSGAMGKGKKSKGKTPDALPNGNDEVERC